MPNGYTADIYDGTNTDPIDYLKRCARAFGTYVLQRDEAITDELPDLPATVGEDNYYRRSESESKTKLAELQRLTPTDIAARFGMAKLRWEKVHEEIAASNVERRERYEAVLAVVEQFKSPSPDHDGFRQQAIDWLHESIKWDADSLTPDPFPYANADQWYAATLQQATRMAQSAKESLADEIERVESRYRWATQLREALDQLACSVTADHS